MRQGGIEGVPLLAQVGLGLLLRIDIDVYSQHALGHAAGTVEELRLGTQPAMPPSGINRPNS